MPRLRNVLMLLATLAVLSPATASAELFFSEYIEGSSFNKAIEIYNPSGVPVDLSDYELRLYSNGSASVSQSVVLSTSLAPGDVYVVSHGSASAGILAVTDLQSSSVVNFNGDDAVQLWKISTASSIDVIGQIGFDPGAEWGTSGTVSTLNNTMRRNSDICTGDPDGSNPFDPTVEWSAFGNDNIAGLGAHTAACGPTPAHSSTWGRVKSLYR